MALYKASAFKVKVLVFSSKLVFLNSIAANLLFSIKCLKVTLSIDADIIYATSTPLTIAIPAIIYSRIKVYGYQL